jgi:hypothetical protein
MSLPTLDEMSFWAFPRNGKWHGRCRELPELRAGPRKDKLGAIDAIITAARDWLREVTPSQPGSAPRRGGRR